MIKSHSTLEIIVELESCRDYDAKPMCQYRLTHHSRDDLRLR